MTGLTLDAGALIAVERGSREMALILAEVRSRGGRVLIPAPALAQVLRDAARQVRLMRLLAHDATEVQPLDRPDAHAVGLLLARTRTSDVVDAHVVLCAMRAEQAVVTSDPRDLRRLAPNLHLIEV